MVSGLCEDWRGKYRNMSQTSLSYIPKNVVLVLVGELILGLFLKKGLKITQFPNISNITTTRHKLQGQTKNI